MSMSGGLAPNEPMVRFQEVTKRYGALTVLDKLDLDVAPNEKVAVIGPSGSGKTTVLRMLMTLERIDGGVIWVDGEPLTHMPQNDQLVPASQAHLRRVRAKIGMVFQHFNLFPHMSALANCMEAPLHVLGLSKAEARERALELLAMVGPSRQDRALSRPAVRRPAAAGRDRARARHAPQGDAVRRGDLGARPRAGRRGPERDPAPGRPSTTSPC